MDKFIIIESKDFIAKYMFSDIESREDVIIKEYPYNLKNRFLNYINIVHFSNKVNKFFEAPFKSIWSKHGTLHNLELKEENNYYIILLDISVNYFTISYLNNLSRRKNVSLNLLMINPINKKNVIRMKRITNKVNFDNIFSFDNIDAKKYGYIHTIEIYSKLNFNKEYKKHNDLLFIGREKKRLDMLHSIFEKANAKGVKCDFDIVGVKKKQQIIEENITYNKKIPYEDVIRKVQETNCLLEVLQEAQSGFTFRTYEAICYNKKLLTNNKNIVNMPFYNSKYIKVFKNVDDIDFEWVKKIEDIDYGYENEFSSINFIKIVKNESKKFR